MAKPSEWALTAHVIAAGEQPSLGRLLCQQPPHMLEGAVQQRLHHQEVQLRLLDRWRGHCQGGGASPTRLRHGARPGYWALLLQLLECFQVLDLGCLRLWRKCTIALCPAFQKSWARFPKTNCSTKALPSCG